MEFPSGIVTQIKQVTAWKTIPGLLSLALSQLIFYTFHLLLYYFTFFQCENHFSISPLFFNLKL